nr:MBL fold metallo-hydrolase [uncultured Shinella sp.]
MRVRIHRGTKEIGGSCIELEAQGARILLDLGLPLGGDPDDITLHPQVDGLQGGENLLALVLSHGHLDHWGLAHLAGPALPVALGAETHRILKAAQPFLPKPYVPHQPVEFSSETPLIFGPFTVTPHLVDHSAYDAYALEVEAGGKRLFYSGDFRAHGRKGALFERLVANPPRNINVLLMEGSTLGRLDADRQFPTETEIESKLLDIFRRAQGMALVAASAQNIDRMVSLYRACKRSGRTLVIDLYAAEVLRATGNVNIPQSDWPNIAVYVPHYQRVRIKQDGRFDLLEPHKANRIFPEDLKAIAGKAAFLFRPAMLADLDRADCLEGAVAVWSQWDGYAGDLVRESAEWIRLCVEFIPLPHLLRQQLLRGISWDRFSLQWVRRADRRHCHHLFRQP